MERLAAAIDGSDSLTADEVRTVVFAKPPMGKRGYDEGEVDALLDIAASMLRERADGGGNEPLTTASHVRQEPLSGYQIRQAILPDSPIGARGYDKRQVDEYLERLATTLDRSGMSLPADQEHRGSFELTNRLRRGYRVEEVDALLERVAAELARRSAGW
jgi:DivIVA domain-containing protein